MLFDNFCKGWYFFLLTGIGTDFWEHCIIDWNFFDSRCHFRATNGKTEKLKNCIKLLFILFKKKQNKTNVVALFHMHLYAINNHVEFGNVITEIFHMLEFWNVGILQVQNYYLDNHHEELLLMYLIFNFLNEMKFVN